MMRPVVCAQAAGADRRSAARIRHAPRLCLFISPPGFWSMAELASHRLRSDGVAGPDATLSIRRAGVEPRMPRLKGYSSRLHSDLSRKTGFHIQGSESCDEGPITGMPLPVFRRRERVAG